MKNESFNAKSKKASLKIASFLMAILMVLCLFPVSVFAEETELIDEEETETDVVKSVSYTQTDIEADGVFNTGGYGSLKINEKCSEDPDELELESMPKSALVDKNGKIVFPYRDTWLRYYYDPTSEVVSLSAESYRMCYYNYTKDENPEPLPLGGGGFGYGYIISDEQPAFYHLDGSVIKDSGFTGATPMHDGYAVILESLEESVPYGNSLSSMFEITDTVKVIDDSGEEIYVFPDSFGVHAGGMGDIYWGEKSFLSTAGLYSEGKIAYTTFNGFTSELKDWQKETGYIILTGEKVITSDEYSYCTDFSDNCAAVRAVGTAKYGYIDSTGNEIITCQYDSVGGFHDGFAAVKKDGKWGYIDKNGNTVIPFEYDDAYGAGSGLFAVVKDGKCGMVNVNNEVIVPLIYDDISSCENGVAYAVKDRKIVIIEPDEVKNIVASGYCGGDTTEEYDSTSGAYKNLWWTLDSEGTLTIGGKGKMKNYSDVCPQWQSYSDKLKGLVIEDGVTSIGAVAFSGYSGFTGDLVIPDGVTDIGEYAFYFCDGFTGKLVIPESVTNIGESAFSGCSGFTGELVIPNSVTSIGNYAFESCYGFTGSLVIPNNVTSIGSGAFRGCRGFTGDLVIPDGVTDIREYAFYFCDSFTGNLVIPNSVESIGVEAFYKCSGFKGNLIIPDSVISIEEKAFYKCSGFTGNLVIPENIASIGDYAFWRTPFDNVYFKGNAPKVTEATDERPSFDSNVTLYYIKGKSGWTTPTWNGYNTEVWKEIETVVVKSVSYVQTDIEADGVFNTGGYGSLKINEIDYGMVSFPKAALIDSKGTFVFPYKDTWLRYRYSDGVVSLTASDSYIKHRLSNWKTDMPAFYSIDGTELFKNTYLYASPMVDGYAFVMVENTEDPYLIDNAYLINRTGKIVYTFPENFSDDIAFGENEYETGITFRSQCGWPSEGLIGYGFYAEPIFDWDFHHEGYKDMSGKTVIEFDNCKYKNGFPFHEGFAKVQSAETGLYGFINLSGDEVIDCQYESALDFTDGFVSVVKDGKWGYVDKNGDTVIPFEYDYAYGAGSGLFAVVKDGKCGMVNVNNEVIVPLIYDDISSCENGAAYAVKDRKIIIIKPDEVKNIVASGFCGGDETAEWDEESDAYKNLWWELDDEGTLTVGGEGEMKSYDTVLNKNVQRYVTSAPWGQYLDQLKTLVIEDGITSIGDDAFFNCRGLTGDLVLPNSVASIGVGAFAGCSGFTGELVIPDGVTSIDYAFAGCSGFTGDLVIPDSVTSIGELSFQGCSGFNGNLVIGNSVTSIGNYAFLNCSGFTGDLVIPNSVTSIGEGAFCDCSGFTGDLVIGNSVTNIGEIAFIGCSGLTGDLVIPNSVTSIGEGAFRDCSGFTGNLVLPNSVASIGDGAFYNAPFDNVYFKGNAPKVTEATDEHASFDSDVTLYYLEGKSGWTSPTWNGYNTEVWDVRDLNFDGIVSNKDVIVLFRLVSTNKTEPYMDFDGSGTVGNKDVLKLFRYVSKFVSP